MRKTPAASQAEKIVRYWALFLFASSSVIVLTLLAAIAGSSLARTALEVMLNWFPGLLTVGGIAMFVFGWRALPGTLSAVIERADPASRREPTPSYGIHLPIEILAVFLTYGSLLMLTVFQIPGLAGCRGCFGTEWGFETLLGLDPLGWAAFLIVAQFLWLLVAILD